jgi:hypothetical protein
LALAQCTLSGRRLGSALLAIGGCLLPCTIPAQSPQNHKPAPRVIAWPGFSTALRNGRYVVAFVDGARRATLPPHGARLVACDGEPAERLARERLDGDVADGAPRLLWDVGDRQVPPLPASCTFETDRGQMVYRMQYGPAPADTIAAAIAAAAGQSRPLPYPRLF